MENGFWAGLFRKSTSKETHSGRRTVKKKPSVFMIALGFILIIGCIAVFKTFKRTKRSTACIDLLNINDAVELFALDNQGLPDDLQVLWDPVDEQGKIYLDWEPVDPWGNPYIYEVNDVSGYELKSLGADGKQGGIAEAKDITVEDAKAAIQERGGP